MPDIGPVKAVRALTYPVAEIARWIEAEDTAALTQLPGIGQRGAQTIVATLAGRLVQEALLQDGAVSEDRCCGAGRSRPLACARMPSRR